MKPAEQTATHMVDTETESAFDISPDEAKEARLDMEAVTDCAAGRIIPNDVVGEWLLELAKWAGRPAHVKVHAKDGFF